MSDDVRTLEIRRLRELEKTAAQYGSQTDPAILIEIQDLRQKYRRSGRRNNAGTRAELEYEFLMNTVAAALRRLTAIEARLSHDDAERPHRQRVLNIWLGAISAGVAISLVLAVIQLWR